MIQVMMKTVTKQHGNGPQATVDLQNECPTEDHLTSFIHDENRNTDSELFSPVMCSDDDDVVDDDDKSTTGITLYVYN